MSELVEFHLSNTLTYIAPKPLFKFVAKLVLTHTHWSQLNNLIFGKIQLPLALIQLSNSSVVQLSIVVSSHICSFKFLSELINLR